METKKYKIVWLDIKKKSLLWDDFEFYSENEDEFVNMPVFIGENLYDVEYNWKNYKCDEKTLSKFKLFFTSDDVRLMEDELLLTENNIIFWILIQTNFNKVKTPYETLFFINYFIDRFQSLIDVDIKEWFELMFWIISAFYWQKTWTVFYKNFKQLIEKSEEEDDEEEILDNMDELFENLSEKLKMLNWK